jgi:hypothetical protein
MPLPQEVYSRLRARAVTDLDLASLLAMFTKPIETVSEPPVDQAGSPSNENLTHGLTDRMQLAASVIRVNTPALSRPLGEIA